MNWTDYYFNRSIPLLESSVQDLLIAAHKIMSPADKEKVTQLLSSPTWGDSWINIVQSAIADRQRKIGKGTLGPREVADIMLDGIDQYLGTNVSNNKAASGRFGIPVVRQVDPTQTNTPKPLFANPHATHGPVSAQEIASRRLNPNHYDVWQGSMADAPSVYKYIYSRATGKYLHNPNYKSA